MKKLYKIFAFFLFLLIIGTHAHAQKSALLWATYYGGDTLTVAEGTCTDKSGNVYITGSTNSNSGIATKGAYQTYGDYINGAAFLAKFDSSGKLLWATYFGDSGDIGECVATDISGNVYITGWVYSSTDIVTRGAYQTSIDSVSAYLAKFNQDGSLVWATYFGGNKKTFGYGVVIDKMENIYLSGSTNSTSGIATTGAYQTSYGGGADDAFLAKFNSFGNLLWATYYGGGNEDYNESEAIDTSDNVYISGVTYSTSGIATQGAYQTSYMGNGDAFLAKFSSSGYLLWATYFGGNNYNEGAGITTDRSGNIFIMGETNSLTGIATKDAYQPIGDSDNYESFLAKFNSAGNLLWGTYFGGDTGNMGFSVTNIVGISTDSTGDVVLAGYTISTFGIATSGAYKASYTGTGFSSNAFIVKFNPSGILLWGTYFGNGNGFRNGDAAYSISTDINNDIYICGATTSISGIATSGAYQTYLNGQEDAFLAKFSIPTFYNDAGISSIISPKGNFCADSTPIFVQLKNYGPDTLHAVKILCSINNAIQLNYTWYGNLSKGSNTTIFIGLYDFKPGINSVKAWTVPIGFEDTLPKNDTAFITDTIKAPPPVPVLKMSHDTLISSAASGNQWLETGKVIKGATSQKYIPTASGSYSVMVTDTDGCSSISASFAFTGINEIQDNPSLIIYPNPSHNTFTVQMKNLKSGEADVTLSDIFGHRISTFSENNKTEFTINAADYELKSGVYIICIRSGESVCFDKLIVE